MQNILRNKMPMIVGLVVVAIFVITLLIINFARTNKTASPKPATETTTKTAPATVPATNASDTANDAAEQTVSIPSTPTVEQTVEVVPAE